MRLYVFKFWISKKKWERIKSVQTFDYHRYSFYVCWMDTYPKRKKKQGGMHNKWDEIFYKCIQFQDKLSCFGFFCRYFRNEFTKESSEINCVIKCLSPSGDYSKQHYFLDNRSSNFTNLVSIGAHSENWAKLSSFLRYRSRICSVRK